MNLFGLMDLSSSALKAQRVRAEVVAANMANAETTRTVDGGPYRRRHVVFSATEPGSFGASLLAQAAPANSNAPAGMLSGKADSPGVEVTGVLEDQGAPLLRFDPTHPDAGPDGYVAYPDINPVTEMVDLLGASRSYGMNVSALQAEKSMLTASMDLIKA